MILFIRQLRIINQPFAVLRILSLLRFHPSLFCLVYIRDRTVDEMVIVISSTIRD